jgi:hypothetical protein
LEKVLSVLTLLPSASLAKKKKKRTVTTVIGSQLVAVESNQLGR